MPEFRTVKRGDQKVKQKKCAAGGEWRDENDFHFRTRDRTNRSSRCRFCAAVAQRDLRLRKKGLQAKKPGGRFGVDITLESTSAAEGSGSAQGAIARRKVS